MGPYRSFNWCLPYSRSVVGTGGVIDYGKFEYEQVLRDAGSKAINLPIDYLSLLCGFMLLQHPSLLTEDEMKSSCNVPAKISFRYKLSQPHNVVDIKRPPFAKVPQYFFASTKAPSVPSMSANLRSHVAWTLIGELKHLKEVISSA